MKKIIFGLSIIGLVGLTSCQDDFMEFEPSNSSEVSGAIENEAQLEIAVLGIYDALQSNYAYGNYYISAQEILSDNGFVLLNNSNRFTDFYRFEHAISSGGSIANMWTIGYRAIARANFVLGFEDIIEGPNVDKIFAEARAIRALQLFNLVNYYARPYGTIDQDLGIPVPTEFEKDTPLPRLSVEEVYNEIINELIIAAEDLPSVTLSNTTRINKEAVYALLSRVYLYKKEYDKSIQFADMALGAVNLLEAQNLNSYYHMPGSFSESLFTIAFDEIDNPGDNDALSATWSLGRYEDTAATTDFYNLIPETDARKSLYQLWNTSDNPAPYGVLKFGSLDNDVIVIRGTEALLNKIESLYYIDPSQALTELVNWVQTYRDSSYSFSGTGQELLDEILLQRRIELAFEGHRYFDLNRYELDIQKSANSTVNSFMPFNDYRRVFPIPLNEMNTNPEMVQNPNYQ